MEKNTSIVLGDHFKNFIQNEITTGRYNSSSEVIRTVLNQGENSQMINDFNPVVFSWVWKMSRTAWRIILDTLSRKPLPETEAQEPLRGKSTACITYGFYWYCLLQSIMTTSGSRGYDSIKLSTNCSPIRYRSFLSMEFSKRLIVACEASSPFFPEGDFSLCIILILCNFAE